MELRRILAPYDFSDAAGRAQRFARGLAAHFAAEVAVVHVLPPLRYDFALAEPTGDRLREVNEQRAANARQALVSVLPRATEGGSVRYDVIEGEPAEEIIAAANEDRYDAIVMSTRGAGAFRRWFMIGSVTSKVLHGSERPVITGVHFENPTSPLAIKRVLCAVDLGPQSLRVLCWGAQAARSFRAELEVAHAAPSADGEDSEGWRNAMRSRLIARIEELKGSLNVEARTLIEFDHPARAISELAQRRRADLVVLGRGVSQCPCPVVSI
jgi:nucleotide-binding universal stress UspA family protein